MKNSHISRNRQLNIPITVKNEVGMINTVADRVAADEAHATAHDRKLNREVSRQKAETEDAEWKRISKIPESSSDLIVITKVKKARRLCNSRNRKVAGKISRSIC